MKIKYLFILIGSVLFFGSCDDDKDENISNAIDITWFGSYDSEPLALYEQLEYGNTNILLQRADFFISDVELINTAGDAIKVAETAFVDFTNQNIDPDDAANGYNTTFLEVPNDSYTMIRFGLGVDAENNALMPANFNSANPLSKADYYWSNWGSYIFMKLEGVFETTDPDDNNLGFVFHTGKDDLYRTIQVPINLEVAENGTNSILLDIDHKKLFDANGSLFDIESSPANHNQNDLTALLMIVDNFQNAITNQ